MLVYLKLIIILRHIYIIRNVLTLFASFIIIVPFSFVIYYILEVIAYIGRSIVLETLFNKVFILHYLNIFYLRGVPIYKCRFILIIENRHVIRQEIYFI